MVIPIWGSGGRDPEVFDNADEIDIDRPNLREHMGFGHGPHFCAAAELARLESKIAFTKIFAAWSDFEVDEERSDLGHLPSFSTHGRRKVVFRFTRA